jgi:hypothetical protein
MKHFNSKFKQSYEQTPASEVTAASTNTRVDVCGLMKNTQCQIV